MARGSCRRDHNGSSSDESYDDAPGPVKRSHNPFPMSKILDRATELLMHSKSWTRTQATTCYGGVKTRCEELLKAGNLGDRLTENVRNKVRVNEALEKFANEPENDIVFSLFSTDPTRAEVLHAFSHNIRRAIRVRAERASKKHKDRWNTGTFQTTPPQSNEAGNQTLLIQPNQATSFGILPTMYHVGTSGLDESSTFRISKRIKELEDTEEDDLLCEANIKYLLIESDKPINVQNLSFAKFLQRARDDTTFDSSTDTLFYMAENENARGDANKVRAISKIIKDEEDWRRHIESQASKSSTHNYEFAKARNVYNGKFKPLDQTMNVEETTILKDELRSFESSWITID